MYQLLPNELYLKDKKNRVEANMNYKLRKHLGSGSYGDVFATSDPKTVVKLTIHEEEAHTIARIMELRKRGIILPAICDFYYMYHDTTAWGNDLFCSIWIIYREAVDPIGFKGFNCWEPERGKGIAATKGYKQTIDTLAKYSVDLWDVRPENYGYSLFPNPERRKGSIVLFDTVANQYPRKWPEITIPSYYRED